MSIFTESEFKFLTERQRGHIGTANERGVPDVAVVNYTLDDSGAFVIRGRDIAGTIKYTNVTSNPVAAFVVDDEDFTAGRGICGVKIHGRTSVVEDSKGRPNIRIVAFQVWSWGINLEVQPYFMGIIERRGVK